MLTKYQFFFLYSILLMFIIQMTALGAGEIITGMPRFSPPSPPVTPQYFVDAETLNKQTGTNCYYETRVLFYPDPFQIGKRNTYKYCSDECKAVQPDCMYSGECYKFGALSCLVATEVGQSPITQFFSLVGWFFGNILYFFQLMTISTPFAIFGAIILTPFFIVLIWILIEIIAMLLGGLGGVV